MTCTKKRFRSSASAARQLKTWLQRSRRTSFEGARPYWCPPCRSYHIGHTVDTGTVPAKVARTPEPLEGIDDLFRRSTQRARAAVKRSTHRYRARLERDYYEGPVVTTHEREVDDSLSLEVRK